MSTVYIENGYENREDYLEELGLEYGEATVNAVAGMLGPEEDFDGLVAMLQDSEYFLQ